MAYRVGPTLNELVSSQLTPQSVPGSAVSDENPL
jgi:hypothetical protein